MSDLRQRYPALMRMLERRVPARMPAAPPPYDPTSIVLGDDSNGDPVSLPLRSRQEHVFMLGATGSGKSMMLLHFMRQAINHEEGLLFLDPHGAHSDSDYRDLLVWAALREKPVHIIDLNAPSIIGFNPLSCPEGTDPAVVAGNVMDALAISWEGESFSQKPSIERVLGAVFIALAELGLTLCEAPLLLDRNDDRRLRAFAIENVRDAHTRHELQRLQELSQDGRRKRDFEMETVGPLNRFARLLRPPVLRQMFGKKENGIDIKTAMDNGEIILANLSGGSQVYERDTDLVGRLLVRTALFEAKRRRNTRPFNFVMDEAHRFLSSDIPTLLAEVRKYGISIVAAMQWLQQARSLDESILAALLNVNCKICFRLRDAKESEELARSIMPLNMERPVKKLIKPTVVGHRRIKLANQSSGQNSSESEGNTRGETQGRSNTRGETVGRSRGNAQSASESQGRSEMQSSSSGNISGSAESSSDIMRWADPGAGADPFIMRQTKGTTASNSSSSGSSQGTARNTGRARGSSVSASESHAQSSAATDSSSTSLSRNDSRSRGTSSSAGESEALEPILEKLPTAVHGLQDQLYAAGLLLRSLPTAVGYVTYVGERGPVSTLFTVPNVATVNIPEEKFIELRDTFLPPPPPVAPPAAEQPEPEPKQLPESPPEPEPDQGERGW